MFAVHVLQDWLLSPAQNVTLERHRQNSRTSWGAYGLSCWSFLPQTLKEEASNQGDSGVPMNLEAGSNDVRVWWRLMISLTQCWFWRHMDYIISIFVNETDKDILWHYLECPVWGEILRILHMCRELPMHDACRSSRYSAILYTGALIVLMSLHGIPSLFSCPQTMWFELLGHILW
jgi:hypothetical protein